MQELIATTTTVENMSLNYSIQIFSNKKNKKTLHIYKDKLIIVNCVFNNYIDAVKYALSFIEPIEDMNNGIN